MQELERVEQLGDRALIEELARSAKHDRLHTVRLLAELGEVHARGLFRELGFSTMFDYATRKLGMSEAEAALRLRAAKLGRMFPIALEMLSRCELNLTTLSLLAPLLSADTLGLLHDARFKSKQQVLELIAKHSPKPDVPDSIRRSPRPSVRAPHVQVTPRPAALAPTTDPNVVAASTAPSVVVPLSPARTPSVVVPLSPARHKITFTAGQRVRDMLEQAQDLRRHRYPAGDLEPLFERALELLLADEQRRRFAQTAKPRTPKTARTKRSRYIPNAVRRRVWARDGGRCCFKGPDNTRCGARGPLQFHHVMPYGRGGATRVENIALLCRAHNALFAERDYGRDFMRARIADSSRTMSGGSTVIRGLDTT